jgi:hypothetical protein
MIRGRTKMRPAASLFKREPAGIKQNYHALRTRASAMKVFCVIGASVTVR